MRILIFLIPILLMSGVSLATPVELHCWIVGNDNGSGCRNMESVTNLVNGVNQVYAQVAMTFTISSVSYTNSTHLANMDADDDSLCSELCGLSSNTGRLELYFVPVLDGGATAFQASDGIVIGPDANARTLAHEIGHACGLDDIYAVSEDGALVVSGPPSKERMPNDWGWYPPSVTQADLVRRLLMYGVRSDSKADLSFGDVYGAYYTSTWNRVTQKWDDHWLLGNAPVGFGLHGNRHPDK